MKAVILEKPGKFIIGERPEPVAGEGEVLVRVHRIGVCGTDIHAFAGNQPFFEYPRILGHELGVEVLKTGPGCTRVKPGDRASVEPYLNDPDSPASRQGRSNCCEKLTVLGVHMDGGHCPLLKVPERKLHLSKRLSYDELALVETLCIGAHGVERSGAGKGTRLLVVGAGPIGLGAAQSAVAAGAEVAVMDISPDRLAFVGKVGIEKRIQLEGDPEEPVRRAFGGELPQVVIDATGNRGSMEKAFSLSAHGGTVVYLGLVQGTVALDDPLLHKKELTLMASRNACPHTFRTVLGRLESGAIDVKPWITERVQASNLPEVFEAAVKAPGTVKVMVEMDFPG